MAATSGYQAGIESNQVILAYAPEAVWGQAPAVPFQEIRYTGESLAGTKTRNRPAEVQATGEVVASITTQETAGGGVNFALSFGTFDDLIAGALKSEWVADTVTTGNASTPAGNQAAARADSLVNGTEFRAFHIQKRFSLALFLRYPGSFVSAMTLTGGVGQFLNGSFTFLSQNEQPFTVDASTGAMLPPPSGRVHDPVGGFKGVYLDGVAIPGVVDSFTLSATAVGAASEYGMGSAASQGVIMGLLEIKGTVKVYFKDYVLYQRFKNETQGVVSFVTRDAAGNGYVISVLNANLLNPKINAGGPNQAVMATFDIEGNPRAAGGTIQIDRLFAT